MPFPELVQSSEEIALRGAIPRAGLVVFENLRVRRSHYPVGVIRIWPFNPDTTLLIDRWCVYPHSFFGI